jgi:cell division transport system permease protein
MSAAASGSFGAASQALGRGAALVPLDSTSGRALAAVIAILTFLAALCAGAAEMVAATSAEWGSAISREATIQIRPTTRGPIEPEVGRAAEIARATPGVAEARPLPKEESERLLEPWLGSGLDLGDLPVPRLVALRFDREARPDLEGLRRRLAAEVPGASLDDHALWLSRLSAMAGTVVAIVVGLGALVILATALAVAFATRGAMAGNREVVEVLHLVGAGDGFIAGEFQRRFFLLGLRGAAIGGALAIGFILALGWLASYWRSGPAGDQIEALFGSFGLGWRSVLAILAIAALVAGVTALVSRWTVRRQLAGEP